MDLFGLKARKRKKEEEKLRKAAELRERYRERKKLIDDFLKKYREEKEKEWRSFVKAEEEKVDKIKNTCPKCGSKNVVNRFARVKGDTHANSNIYSSRSMFSGNLTYNSISDGKCDTFAINKCNDCTHEWPVAEYEYEKGTQDDDFSKWSSVSPGFFFRKVIDYLGLNYDPYDETETCASMEEKQQEFCEKYSKCRTLDCYRNIPKYMVEYAFYEGCCERSSFVDDASILLRIGIVGKDNYSYTFPEEIWDIVKQLIGWKGAGKE